MDIRSGDMRAEGAASYPGSERAALVALLRTRPEGMRWPEMTAGVLEAVAEHEQLSILRQVLRDIRTAPPSIRRTSR
jgi:hypothetical protein